jgi:hypothetical protein
LDKHALVPSEQRQRLWCVRFASSLSCAAKRYADNCSEADYYSPMAGDYDLSRINVSVNPHFAALQTARGTMYAGSITGTTTVPVYKLFCNDRYLHGHSYPRLISQKIEHQGHDIRSHLLARVCWELSS